MARARNLLVVGGALLLLGACTLKVEPLDGPATLDRSLARLERLEAEQVAPVQPLDLSEAIARALLFNLDHRAMLMSETLASADLSKTRYALWPQWALSAGYNERDRYSLSVSRDPNTGAQTLQPSTSSDRRTTTNQLQLSWNALDFGVGYLRTKQKGNALLIAEEQRRKAFQSVAQHVTQAWWRALAAQELQPQLVEVRARIESALERSRRMEALRLQGQSTALDYQRDLLLSLKRLSALDKELQRARAELAQLLALPSLDGVLLAEAETEEPDWLAGVSLEQMRLLALANRPELREINYRQRMAQLESKVTVASLLPSLGVYAGARYDSNSYLEHNSWRESGLQFSFNLLNLAAFPATRRYGKAMQAVESLRADAMTMAVLAQIDIALQSMDSDRQGLCLSRELDRVASAREQQQGARAASAAGDELSWIRAQLEAILAGLENAFTRAEVETSQMLLLGSLGIDPYPENLEPAAVDEVSAALREYFASGLQQRIKHEVEALPAEVVGQGETSVLPPLQEWCR